MKKVTSVTETEVWAQQHEPLTETDLTLAAPGGQSSSNRGQQRVPDMTPFPTSDLLQVNYIRSLLSWKAQHFVLTGVGT